MKTIRAIRLPRGNQPRIPVSAPVSDLVEEVLGTSGPFCLLGVGTRPEGPCPIGRDRGCVWNAWSETDRYCGWVALRRGDIPTQELAGMLGISKERLRQILAAARAALSQEEVCRDL